jgi:hypothetical protein
MTVLEIQMRPCLTVDETLEDCRSGACSTDSTFSGSEERWAKVENFSMLRVTYQDLPEGNTRGNSEI